MYAYQAYMKRISLFVSEPQYQRFRQLARVAGRPYAELVREALDSYLRANVRRTLRPTYNRKKADTVRE